MSSCLMCGKCCETIALPFDMSEIMFRCAREKKRLRYLSKTERGEKYRTQDIFFAKNCFNQISKEEAYQKNPNMVAWNKYVERYSFYSCKHFCKKTRKCRINNRKPIICIGYPFYGCQPEEQIGYDQNCPMVLDFYYLRITEIIKEKFKNIMNNIIDKDLKL